MATLFAGTQFLRGTQKFSSAKEEIKADDKLQIHTANKLLDNKKYQTLINQCNELLDFNSDQRDTYLTPLIHAFAEFVQDLPETRNSYFCRPGGFIDHALMRTASALSMCRAYFSAESSTGKETTKLSATESLWMYTLFSACIFNGIGKVFSDMTVELYDENGKYLDRWSPFEGNMLQTKAFQYDYDYEDARHADLFSRRISVLLAKQLIPFKGFAWISSNKEALSVWLALLEENQRDGGTLSPFLIRADALAINTYFDEKRLQKEYMLLDSEAKELTDIEAKEKEESLEKKFEEKFAQTEKEKGFFKTFTHESDKTKKTNKQTAERNPNTQAGIEFLKWLTKQFRSESIFLNDSVFYLPTGAIFLPTAIFEEFQKKHQYYRSTDDIIASFNKLQLQTKGEGSNDLHSFIKQDFSSKTKTVQSTKIDGVVLSNPQIVLPQTVTIAQQNGTKQTIKTAELANYSHTLVPLTPVGNSAVVSTGTLLPAAEVVGTDANLKSYFMFGR